MKSISRKLSFPALVFALASTVALAAEPQWETVADSVSTASIERVGQAGSFFSLSTSHSHSYLVVGIPVTVAMSGCERFTGARHKTLSDATQAFSLLVSRQALQQACTQVIHYQNVVVPISVTASHTEGPVVTRTVKVLDPHHGGTYHQVRIDRDARTVLVSAIVPVRPADEE